MENIANFEKFEQKQFINTKNTVFRGETKHSSRNLAQKICLIRSCKLVQCSWNNQYELDPRLIL